MPYSINLFRAVDALSTAVDLVGVDDALHGKRVGIMALRVAERLQWPQSRQQDLLYASFLHDCGVSTTEEHGHLVTELEWSNAQGHCERGAAHLSGVPLLAHLAPFVLNHHTRWAELIRRDVPPEIAETANLIFLADRLDVLRAAYGPADAYERKAEFLATLHKYSGLLFKPELVDALDKCSQSEAFWFGLDPQLIELHIREQAMRAKAVTLNLDDLRSIAVMFAHIIDAKSQFTAEHSVCVAKLSRFIGNGMGLDQETCDTLEVAGYLHDLGKLRVPDAILDKQGPLTPHERLAMNRHAFDTYEILFRLFGDDPIALWAAFHHETLSGEGYPFQLTAGGLPMGARVIAVADIVQALVQNRPYRASLPPAKVLSIIEDMTKAGRLDSGVVDFVRANLQKCWSEAGGLQKEVAAE